MTYSLRKRWTGLLLSGLIAGTAMFVAQSSCADTSDTRYQKSMAGLDRFRENMNGRWFAFTMRRQYDTDRATQKQEAHGIIYYSDSLTYMAYLRFFDSASGETSQIEHVEGVITDRWVIARDHKRNPEALEYAESSSPQFSQIVYSLRFYSDITLLFERYVVDIATHEFARPSLDPDGRLVVTHDRARYMRDPNPQHLRNQPVLEVIFEGEADIRPLGTRLLMPQDNGQLQRCGFVDVRYTRTGEGKAILQQITSDVRREAELPSHEVLQIQCRETARPSWSSWPPRISLRQATVAAGGLESLVPGHPDESEFASEISLLVRVPDDNQLSEFLIQQTTSLETTDEYVAAVAVNPPEGTADARSHHNRPAESSPGLPVPLMLALILLCIVSCWVVLWRRTYSGRL